MFHFRNELVPHLHSSSATARIEGVFFGGGQLTQRIRSVVFQEKDILVVDCTDCSAAELAATIRALPDYVTFSRLRQSVYSQISPERRLMRMESAP